jgi:hypothetical protein
MLQSCWNIYPLSLHTSLQVAANNMNRSNALNDNPSSILSDDGVAIVEIAEESERQRSKHPDTPPCAAESDNDESFPRRSKPDGPSPVASLVQALAMIPATTTAAAMRHPFRHKARAKTSDCADDTSNHDETEASISRVELDDSLPEQLLEEEDEAEDTESQHPGEVAEGKLIRRRRSKQLSKGRRVNRRLRAAHLEKKMNASEGSWDKLVKLAESFSTDMKLEDSFDERNRLREGE